MIENLETSRGRFRVRTYQEGDGPRIRALFREVFGHEKREDLWEWEFRRNPYGTRIMLCEHESGALVAQCAAIPVPLYYRGEIIPAAQLVDCMSKKSFRALAVRKQGLFAITTQAFFDYYTGENRDVYLYGFPGVRHYRLGALLLKYRKTQPYVHLQLTHPAPRRNLFRRLVRLTPGVVENREAAVAELRRADQEHHPLSLYKEPAYLRWRYAEAPRDYTVVGLQSLTGKLLSLAYLQPRGENAYRLLDFFGYRHMDRLMGQFRAETGATVTLWLPKPHCSLFSHSVPLADDIGAVPVGRSFHAGLDWDWANEHFFYTMGDCDLF